jgi:hypothetical protein
MIDEAQLEREFSLRAAVLMQAILDVLHPSAAIRSEACSWIAGEVPSPSGYSFGEISDLLHIDRDAARGKLLRNAARSGRRLRHVVRHPIRQLVRQR